MNVIIEGYVFRGVYLNISVWILRGDERILLLAFVLHLVLMFPGNSNFVKKDLPKANETITQRLKRENIKNTGDQQGFLLDVFRAARLSNWLGLCVCVCVCERERERLLIELLRKIG